MYTSMVLCGFHLRVILETSLAEETLAVEAVDDSRIAVETIPAGLPAGLCLFSFCVVDVHHLYDVAQGKVGWEPLHAIAGHISRALAHWAVDGKLGRVGLRVASNTQARDSDSLQALLTEGMETNQNFWGLVTETTNGAYQLSIDLLSETCYW